MKKIFIYLLFFYINNLYADKNIIDEKISNWYSNLCSSNIEDVVSLYSSNITFLPSIVAPFDLASFEANSLTSLSSFILLAKSLSLTEDFDDKVGTKFS